MSKTQVDLPELKALVSTARDQGKERLAIELLLEYADSATNAFAQVCAERDSLKELVPDVYLAQSQRTQVDAFVAAAQHGEQKALFEAASAAVCHTKVQTEAKMAEDLSRRVKNANRPSMVLAVNIRQDEEFRDYVVTFGNMEVRGTCPEEAMMTFDRMWVGKDE